MYKVCQCCPISPISLACWRSSGEGAEEVGCGRRRCGEGSGSWCCGCVCVCWKGPSWLPRCSAPGNRSPDPGTRAGEAALRGAWPLLVSSGPLQSPVPFESPSAWSGPWSTSGPGSRSSGHAASKRQKNPNRRRRCDWFRNHHRRVVQPVRTVSAERNGSMRAQKRHLRENIRHAPPSRASPRAIVVFSPRLPLCLPPILAIMRR